MVWAHLEQDELPFEDGQEVSRLLAHDHPDLDGRPLEAVVHVHRLEGTRCHLVPGGVAALPHTIRSVLC